MKLLLVFLSFYGLFQAYPQSGVNYRNVLAHYGHPKFRPETRIINGTEAVPHAYPYQVLLRMHFFFYTERCDGSLITPDTVLTVAHCLTRAYKAEVILGAHNISNKAEPTQIRLESKQFIFHENWDEENFRNDIGLVKLPYPVQLNQAIQTLKLPTGSSNNYVHYKANVTGWGKTADVPTNRGSDVLEVLETTVISNEECKTYPNFKDAIADTELCTEDYKIDGFCDGDSGSPLVTHGIQIGISSFVYKNCSKGMPSVYTRVTSYLDWIAKHVYLL